MSTTGGPAGGDVATAAHAAMLDGDAEALRLLLHPYLHWTQPDGTVVRGRRNVLALLETSGPPASVGTVELRDGQVYRWTCPA